MISFSDRCELLDFAMALVISILTFVAEYLAILVLLSQHTLPISVVVAELALIVDLCLRLGGLGRAALF